MKTRQAAFLASICLSLLTACSFNAQETPESVSTNKQIEKAAPIDRSSFALNAFHSAVDAASENENVVVSPLGIYRILGALSIGTDGKTKAEIDAAIGCKEDDEKWINETSELYRNLNDDDETALAGSLWIQNNLKIKDSYLERLRAVSDQEARNVDFAADATKTINDWFASKTDGKIVDLLREVPLDSQLFIADAVQFRGEWKRAFDPNETRKSYFKGLGDDAKDLLIPSMWTKNSFPYCQDDGVQYLELPYRDERYSMVVVLPDAGRYAEIEKNLTVKNLKKWQNQAKETEIRVLLPKFAVDRKTNLVDVLKKLGVVEAFGNDANFKPTVEEVALKLGMVVQGAFLKIDEKGTEAAAGTGASLVLKSAGPVDKTPKFYADRPFLYLIRRNADSEIIFCGRFVDASAALEESERVEANSEEESQRELDSTRQDDLGLVGIGGIME